MLEAIPVEDQAEGVRERNLAMEELPKERTLGLVWQPEVDKFQFIVTPKEKPFTRRGVLAVISSVFDPLGFLAPVVLPAKKLLQDLCRKYGLAWDQPIHEEHMESWKSWLQDLQCLKEMPIERCLEMRSGMEAEMHCFSGASMLGTAAVLYVRQRQEDGRWSVRFLMAKAKVSPAKAVATMPRLELVAAVTSVRLAAHARRELKWDGRVFFHTVRWCSSIS